MKPIDYYQLRFYYHNTTDFNQTFYDSAIIYESLEEAEKHADEDWHDLAEPSEVLDLVTIRHLLVYFHDPC